MDLYCYHIEVECNVEVANVIYYWMYISVSQMKCLTVCKRRRKINECYRIQVECNVEEAKKDDENVEVVPES